MPIKGIEKFSLLDYDDKISCVLFFSNCNMRCPFCHNAPLVLDPTFGEDLVYDDIYKYLEKRKGLVDAVVITGGEPTLTPNIIDIIRDVKGLGYLVKLDTNGTNPQVINALLEEGLLDYIAMDIKNSYDKYMVTAGVNVNLDHIKESISIIMNSGIDYEFRTTIINEYHTLHDIEKIGDMIKGAKKVRLQKFIDRGSCIKGGLHEVNEKMAKEMVDELKKYVENAELRGY